MAGKKWLKGFLKRNKELSMRTPQGVSAARIKSFNSENVKIFFDILEPQLEKIKYLPHRLYNVDETGITVVQHKHSKILALKGKKQVGSLTSLERGKLITVVTAMNAAGTFVPPLIVFPRKNMSEALMEGAPRGSIWACHPSGWIQGYIFTQWLSHFISFTKPTKEDPVLLILDGHYSRTRNLDVITMAKENNVAIICLPPHSSHKMQPLDVAFMSPFKTYYAQEIETWLRNNPGRTVPNTIICKLFGAAYERAATMEISVNGFRKTGIFPLNKHIFRDHDFAVHGQNQNISPGKTSRAEEECDNHYANCSGETEPIDHCFRQQQPMSQCSRQSEPIPHCSRDNEPGYSLIDQEENNEFIREKTPEPDQLPITITYPSDLTPIPQIDAQLKTARSSTANLITSTPYKNELEEKEEIKRLKLQVASLKKENKENNSGGIKQKVKKKVIKKEPKDENIKKNVLTKNINKIEKKSLQKTGSQKGINLAVNLQSQQSLLHS